MSKDNGGSAFPYEFKFGDGTAEQAFGMTLRDYFAAKAMQASIVREGIPDHSGLLSWIAESAYNMADVLLAERSKQ